MIQEQIELEKKITQTAIDTYRREFEKNKQNENLGNTKVGTELLSRIITLYKQSIESYLKDYGKGKATKSTIAAKVISRLDIDIVSYVSAKVLLNKTGVISTVQSVYRAIGQALEDEYKMQLYKKENSFYYKTIQEDLNSRGAKANRKKDVLNVVFSKKLQFHIERWTQTEKFQAGLVLTQLFIESTGLIEFHTVYKKNKVIKHIIATKELLDWIEDTNSKLEVMQPFFLPMVCKPKEWTGIFEGGYLSPYIKRSKLVKNNNQNYLHILSQTDMPIVYDAINHLQNTEWQINRQILTTVNALWEEGRAIAELPEREDIELIPYPYPDKNTKTDSYTEEEIEIIKKWKRETCEIHKTNVKRRSIRISTAQILSIANRFKDYEKIWFPYQMDFRGRLYPIPVLLQPQGSDLAKGLLRFAEGKKVKDDENAIKWLKIHGANVYGYDKGSYKERVDWVHNNIEQIKLYAQDPLGNRGWAEADKPFQFLAWCFEYSEYLSDPDNFRTHIPIQLDGTCNGLQHYSALLRDEVSGEAVNLINSDRPSDIYAKVAERLEEKLNEIIRLGNRSFNTSDSDWARNWLAIGINRKLTKRPVMVLPYGGTRLSCREYISEYLQDNYSSTFIWQKFGIGESPNDCIFKISNWLSSYLWEAITETLQSAIVGMAYLKQLAGIVNSKGKPLDWVTPVGLPIREEYPATKRKQIITELYGSLLQVLVKLPQKDSIDKRKQSNGICPNFIHSLDAACLMLYLVKCKKAGINSFMTVHDCYGTHATDTEISAILLREAFVEIYKTPVLQNFTQNVLEQSSELLQLPEYPKTGNLDIEEVLKSNYFFN